MNNKIFLNLFIVLSSIGLVFFFRIESRKTSYTIQKKYEVLKDKRKNYQKIAAQFKTKIGEDTLYKKNKSMVTLRAAKNQQIVMVNNEVMVFN